MESQQQSNNNEIGKIDPVYPKKEFVKDLIIWIIIWGSCAIFAHLMMWGISTSEATPLDNSAYVILWGSTISAILFCSILGYLYARAFTNRFTYEITQKFIIIRKGVFTREKCTIPFSRIQNITVNQGIIDRPYGLYTVKIETAGVSGVSAQGGTAASEGFIPGIRDPSKIEKVINELVHEYTQAPYTDSRLKGKIFDNPEIAFDEFAAYFLQKIQEGKSVKNNLAELRKKKNISQEQLAEKAGVSRTTIYNLEHGTFAPSLPLGYLLAKILDVSVYDLFIMDEKDEEQPKQ